MEVPRVGYHSLRNLILKVSKLGMSLRHLFEARTLCGVLVFFESAFLPVFFFTFFFTIAMLCAPSDLRASSENNSPPRTKSTSEILNEAREKTWADDTVWQALLHLYQGRPQIEDPEFYVAKKFVSASVELEETINAVFSSAPGPEPGSSESIQCRFPARVQWLSEKMGRQSPDSSACKDLNEFRRRAPMASAALIFAAEKISHPSTMMGHVFLKISGLNHLQQPVDHAISFFTDLNDGNFPKLVYESLLTGKTGFYALSPFEEVKNGYLFSEERNIWEYELALNDSARQRLHLHLFELKSTSFRYFFIGFNCATLIQNVIAVAHPEVNDMRGLWVTPLDVVRATDKPDFVAATKVAPSSRWKIKVLHEALDTSSKSIKLLRRLDNESTPPGEGVAQYVAEVERRSADDSARYLHLELAEAFVGNLLENQRISEDRWKSLRSDLTGRRKSFVSDGFVDLSSFKRPSLTRRDSQLTLSSHHDPAERSLRLRFLPASHSLEDETLQYTSESELKIGEIEAEYVMNENRMRVSRAVLYSATSLQPTDRLIPTLSGRFRMGFETSREIDLSRAPSPVLEGGLGKTYRMADDIDVFALASLGVRVPSEAYVYAGPEIGVVVRQIWRMKTIVVWRKLFLGFGAQDEAKVNAEAWSRSLTEVKVTQTVNFKDFAVLASISLHDNTRASRPSIELSLRRYF